MLQAPHVSLESDGLIPSAKVQPRNVKGNPRADARGALGLVAADTRLSRLKFEAQPVIKGVTLSFMNVYQNILVRFGSTWILYGGINFVKNPQIIETALSVKHILLAQRRLRYDLQLSVNDIRSSVVQA